MGHGPVLEGDQAWRIRHIRVAMSELAQEQARTAHILMDWFTGRRHPNTQSDLFWLLQHLDTLAIATDEARRATRDALKAEYQASGRDDLSDDIAA